MTRSAVLRILCFSLSLIGLGAAVLSVRLPEEDKTPTDYPSPVWVDMHAHPDYFHRAPVREIGRDELNRYLSGGISVVVSCISSDAPYHGGYGLLDGAHIERLRSGKEYNVLPGDVLAFTSQRLRILRNTARTSNIIKLAREKHFEESCSMTW